MATTIYSPQVEQWRPAIEKEFAARGLDPALVDKALYVINGESGGDPGAVNPTSGAAGLVQMLPSHGYDGKDPNVAIKWMADQVANHGWTDWGEGVTYNGQPFGVLGVHPYGGAAPVATGTTATSAVVPPGQQNLVGSDYTSALTHPAFDTIASAAAEPAPAAPVPARMAAAFAPAATDTTATAIANPVTPTSADAFAQDLIKQAPAITQPFVQSAYDNAVRAGNDTLKAVQDALEESIHGGANPNTGRFDPLNPKGLPATTGFGTNLPAQAVQQIPGEKSLPAPVRLAAETAPYLLSPEGGAVTVVKRAAIGTGLIAGADTALTKSGVNPTVASLVSQVGSSAITHRLTSERTGPVLSATEGEPRPGESPAARMAAEPTANTWEQQFIDLSAKVRAAEKTPGRLMSPEETAASNADWKAYSRSRGYTEAEISDLDHLMKMVEEGKARGYTEDDLFALELPNINSHIPPAVPVTSHLDLADAPAVVSGPTQMLHGTGQRFEQFDAGGMDATALYGPGVYLTDNPTVAEGYARSRGRKGGDPNVASVEVKPGLKLLNMEQPLPEDAAQYFRTQNETATYDADAWDMAVQAIDAGKPGKEVYAAFRDGLAGDGTTSVLDAAESLDGVNTGLKEIGYDGLAHEGGIRGGQKHLVNIIFDPADVQINGTEAVASRTPPAEPPAQPPVDSGPPPPTEPPSTGPTEGGSQSAGPKTVSLYRGSTEGVPTVGGAEFYTPDRKVAETYAGSSGKVRAADITFTNLLETDNWLTAKDQLGLPRSATMEDLINSARDAGYDGVTFQTSNGQEYINIGGKEAVLPAEPPDLPPTEPPSTGPTEPPSGGGLSPSDMALLKLNTAIKMSENLPYESEALRQKVRSQRAAQAYSAMGGTGSEFEKAQNARNAVFQTGELPRGDFTYPVDFAFTPEEKDALYSVLNSKQADIGPYNHGRAVDATQKVLNGEFNKLQPSEMALLGDIYGPELRDTIQNRVRDSLGPDRLSDRLMHAGSRLGANLVNAINIPVTTATFGHAPVLRQGLGIALTHWKQAAESLANGEKVLFNPDNISTIRQGLNENPWIRGTEDATGVIGSEQAARGLRALDFRKPGQVPDETFVRHLIENLPVIGSIARRSSGFARTYLESLRELSYAQEAQRLWDSGERRSREFRATWDALSHATGFGTDETPTLAGINPAFSWKALVGRVKSMADPIMQPGTANPLGPGARAVAIRNLAGIAAFSGTIFALGKLTGAKVNLDPISGGPKMRVGLTSIDPTAGNGTILRTAAKLEQNIQEGIQQHKSPQDIWHDLQSTIVDFSRSQFGPGWGYMASLLTGKDWKGQNVTPTEATRNLITDSAPITAKSIYDGYALAGTKGALLSLPSAGAMSVDTYETPSDIGSQKIALGIKAGILPPIYKDANGKTQPVKSITDLGYADPAAQDQFLRDNPGIASARTAASSEVTQDVRKKQVDFYNQQLKRDDQLLATNPSAWRQESSDAANELRLRIDQEYTDAGGFKGKPKSLLDVAQKKYHEAILAATNPNDSSKVDWNQVDRTVAQLSTDEQDLLFKSSLKGETPARQQYIRDLKQLGPYLDQRDQAWQAFKADKPQLGGYDHFDDFRQSLIVVAHNAGATWSQAASKVDSALGPVEKQFAGQASIYLAQRARTLLPLLDKYDYYTPAAFAGAQLQLRQEDFTAGSGQNPSAR